MVQSSKTEYRYTSDIMGYQEAVWDYLMEHCDITPGGSFFIKFHTDGRSNFEKHVKARWKYNYHREDVITKKELAQDKKERTQAEKLAKKEAFETGKRTRRAERMRTLQAVKILNTMPRPFKTLTRRLLIGTGYLVK
jgi:hypothetical protein